MSLPLGVPRRAFSYDDALEDTAPMTPPPADLCASVLWKQPVIPERKYQELSKDEEGDANMKPVVTPSSSTENVNKVPVVKAKATHVIMNSLITKQTQESIQRFEQQAGLREAGYTPHKGLTTEETKYHRVAEALHNLKMQNGETTKMTNRILLLSPLQAAPLTPPPGINPGGFTVQSYKGAQKPSPMELMRAQATRMTEDPGTFKPPKMDIPGTDGRKQSPRSHNIKPRDLNVLTPTGF
ncbi:hypothetical protein DUI87_26712 [Hirundo rustica rustica]|uniref:Putative monooxygenase p33MONOX n=1 Tax=Hirundo rustica rustica TaxID=333673 RepID=A0A3M0J6D3_HIRRU|nr:hypothetical protein DUI87_26712 [Hirundo rustica rustica]